jgi:low affinity Fe/Cu permease
MGTPAQTALYLVEEASMTMLGLSPMVTLIQNSMYRYSDRMVLDARIDIQIWQKVPNMGQKLQCGLRRAKLDLLR